ncbi:unnamed protein product [Lampetra fluviatilis]
MSVPSAPSHTPNARRDGSLNCIALQNPPSSVEFCDVRPAVCGGGPRDGTVDMSTARRGPPPHRSSSSPCHRWCAAVVVVVAEHRAVNEMKQPARGRDRVLNTAGGIAGSTIPPPSCRSGKSKAVLRTAPQEDANGNAHGSSSSGGGRQRKGMRAGRQRAPIVVLLHSLTGNRSTGGSLTWQQARALGTHWARSGG